MKKAILIDYKYCTGCHTCEVACQKHLGLEPDKWGIKLTQIGPDEVAPRQWQYEFVPVPTDRCNRCADRLERGKRAMFEASFGSRYVTFELDDWVGRIDGDKFALFV